MAHKFFLQNEALRTESVKTCPYVENKLVLISYPRFIKDQLTQLLVYLFKNKTNQFN